MKTLSKIGAIALGYVLAFLLAWGVLAIYVAATDSPEKQASAGMASFGDAFVFLCVFGLAAMPPTAGALIVLRPFRWFWNVLATVALGVALTAAATAIAYVGWRADAAHPQLQWLAMLAPMRMLFAPLSGLCLCASALFAPGGSARIALAIATLIEGASFAGFVLTLYRMASAP